ncbi:Uncharacterized protein dnm_075490 [Desulfonema magnum]|uniref:Uncharacterized protein n=1 Tax=Desulfonema magnum TaxID=45655 RepID=A0A975GRV7_9BACT|nr:Uncharacterized protein dnm_075490 [Desulfonema magnum]
MFAPLFNFAGRYPHSETATPFMRSEKDGIETLILQRFKLLDKIDENQ